MRGTVTEVPLISKRPPPPALLLFILRILFAHFLQTRWAHARAYTLHTRTSLPYAVHHDTMIHCHAVWQYRVKMMIAIPRCVWVGSCFEYLFSNRNKTVNNSQNQSNKKLCEKKVSSSLALFHQTRKWPAFGRQHATQTPAPPTVSPVALPPPALKYNRRQRCRRHRDYRVSLPAGRSAG